MSIANIEDLTRRALSQDKLWLFVDYDGTLAEFAPTPAYVEPVPEVVDLIARLAVKKNLRLTVLSGRRLGDMRILIPVEGIYLAGTYGIELQTPAGDLIEQARYEDLRPFLVQIKPKWAEIIDQKSGFFLEDKGWSLAIHARFVEDEQAVSTLTEARNIIQSVLPDGKFRILSGYKFLEIAPLIARKRETVYFLLERYPLPGAQLLYIGDDDKDEEAFEAIHAYGGIAVRVFPDPQPIQPTQADFTFNSPLAVKAWLETLLAHMK